MSCPCFEPTEPLPWSRWKGKFRPPLGAPYAGRCHAVAPAVAAPDELLVEGCNMGYARALCSRLAEEAPDAARFELRRSPKQTVTVLWLLEKDCLPLRHGAASWPLDDTADPPLPSPLRQQAEAFARSVLEGVVIR